MGKHCESLSRLRCVIARVYGLTNEEQTRRITRCIVDIVNFLITYAELHVVPGHILDFILVSAIALNRIEKQHPQHRHTVEEVQREMQHIFSECWDNAVSTATITGTAAVDNANGAPDAKLTFSMRNDFAHMCCFADLAAARMFLLRLEGQEIREMVV